jgi:hypothetical protein
MIDKLSNLTLTVIKSNVSIVLVFYVCGFLSFLAYYRVLGLPYISGNAQLYAELAGKNLIVILQTIILLISEPKELVNIFRDSAWTGSTIYIWSISVLLLVSISIVFKCFAQNNRIIAIQQTRYITTIQLALIAIVVMSVFHIEIQPFYAENVLQQTSQSNKFYQQKQNILNYEKQANKIDYDKRLKLISTLHNRENNITEFFFATSEKYDVLGNDNKRIHALMLIIFTTMITAIILGCYYQHTFVRWLIYIFTFAQVLFIPFNYGILGAKYEYPVITLNYSEKDKVLHKQAVFLLAKAQDSLIIYDRLNFSQIQYIPSSTVINFEQQFTSSPFSNCSDGEFKPCEFFAIQP